MAPWLVGSQPRRVAEQPGTSHSEMKCDSILHGALGAPGSGCHPHKIFGLQDWADCAPTSISLSSWIQMGTYPWLSLFSSWSFWQDWWCVWALYAAYLLEYLKDSEFSYKSHSLVNYSVDFFFPKQEMLNPNQSSVVGDQIYLWQGFKQYGRELLFWPHDTVFT